MCEREVTITPIVKKSNISIPKDEMPMKNATPLMYNGIDEYKEYLENTGTCVIGNFIGMYGEDSK